MMLEQAVVSIQLTMTLSSRLALPVAAGWLVHAVKEVRATWLPRLDPACERARPCQCVSRPRTERMGAIRQVVTVRPHPVLAGGG